MARLDLIQLRIKWRIKVDFWSNPGKMCYLNYLLKGSSNGIRMKWIDLREVKN